MADDKPATEANAPTIATGETTSAPVVQDDAEARYQKLEEEKENYRKAYLKVSDERKATRDSSGSDEDSRMREIAQETLANSRLAEIAREQDAIIQKTLKENRELKLARLNKTEPPTAVGTHTESTPVRDTLVTPDQMAYFKSKNWTDKDIERYKKNLAKRM